MTAPPTDGIDRLMHFVDARLAQLGMSKDRAARAGFPNPSTLSKVRSSTTQTHPTVRTLGRIDASIGWQPGSAAVTLLGGNPVPIAARRRANGDKDTDPLTGDDIQALLVARIRDEIATTRRDIDTAMARLRRACTLLDAVGDACDGLDDALIVAER